MTEYYAQLSNIPNTTDFSQSFLFGSVSLNIRFFWCTDIDEELSLYEAALDTRAKSDPLIKDIDIRRNYDWLALYHTEIPHTTQQDVQDWLEETGYIPQSLLPLQGNMFLLVTEMYNRCLEADEIYARLEPYYEQQCWHVEILDDEGNTVSGVVRQGGWLNEQNSRWRLQFESDKPIKQNDLLELTINCEVADA